MAARSIHVSLPEKNQTRRAALCFLLGIEQWHEEIGLLSVNDGSEECNMLGSFLFGLALLFILPSTTDGTLSWTSLCLPCLLAWLVTSPLSFAIFFINTP